MLRLKAREVKKDREKGMADKNPVELGSTEDLGTLSRQGLFEGRVVLFGALTLRYQFRGFRLCTVADIINE